MAAHVHCLVHCSIPVMRHSVRFTAVDVHQSQRQRFDHMDSAGFMVGLMVTSSKRIQLDIFRNRLYYLNPVSPHI